MRKLIIILWIMMMSVLFCVGCGKKDNTASETNQEHSQDDGHDHSADDHEH